MHADSRISTDSCGLPERVGALIGPAAHVVHAAGVMCMQPSPWLNVVANLMHAHHKPYGMHPVVGASTPQVGPNNTLQCTPLLATA